MPTKPAASNGSSKQLWSIWFINIIVSIYDFFTLPIYFVLYKPWKVKRLANRTRAHLVGDFTWANVEAENHHSSKNKTITTLDELFRVSVASFGPKHAIGIRKILGVKYKETEKKATHTVNGNGDKQASTIPSSQQQSNGHQQSNQLQQEAAVNKQQARKHISKLKLEDKFTWFTYSEIEQIVKQLSAGLVSSCNDSLINSDNSRKLLIAGDTCMQWFLIAHACFRNNITLVTTYTTLDDDAILHSITQTEVKIMVVSQKFAKRLQKIIPRAPSVDTIIILDNPMPGEQDEIVNVKSLLSSTTTLRRVISYNDLVERGKHVDEQIESPPTANDIAVLMYTSGSTGKAKGVMLSQRNIVYTALSFVGPGEILDSDRYLGYLPLGHVLELSAECIFMLNGSKIAYSSPMTLTGKSPFIEKNARGDADIVKPTIMAAVPLVLDRLKSAIQQAVKSQGEFCDQFVNRWLIQYKRYWYDRYYDTPITNFIVCRKFNRIFGGNLRTICSGGAALSRETHEYLRHVSNFTLFQGYGLTETSAAASFCDIYERRYNVVGQPYLTVQIKLVDWADYSVHDKPYPRGEIIVGGLSVSQGYYKMEKETNESFYVDKETNTRYFRTGDIGLMLPDGVLKIIDRKKDLVKPLCGEYISLSEIEQALGTSQLIENVCVYCSQFSNYIIAIVRPNVHELRRLARQLYAEDSTLSVEFKEWLQIEKARLTSDTSSNDSMEKSSKQQTTLYDEPSISKDDASVSNDQSLEAIIGFISNASLCNCRPLIERVKSIVINIGQERKLRKFQIPSNIKLASEEWTPENGLITASFKLRRRELEKFYAKDIERLYAEIGETISVNLN